MDKPQETLDNVIYDNVIHDNVVHDNIIYYNIFGPELKNGERFDAGEIMDMPLVQFLEKHAGHLFGRARTYFKFVGSEIEMVRQESQPVISVNMRDIIEFPLQQSLGIYGIGKRTVEIANNYLNFNYGFSLGNKLF